MKRLIGAVVVFMACLVMADGALAFSYQTANTVNDHVSVSPNGKGDLLLFPVYMAVGGDFPIQTNLSIVNTSKTHCVVAKIVFRSLVYSEELLDFFLYLSPTDMWVGSIKYDAVTKEPMVVSSDASGPVLVAGKAINKPNCADDSREYGYIEVIEAWSADLGVPPVSKTLIRDTYNGTEPATYTPEQTINTLAGSYQITIPTIGWEASDNAVVLRDYDNLKYLLLSLETLIGVNGLARNNVQEIDSVLNKTDIAMTYNSSVETGGTLHVFTFPTKLSDFKNCSRKARASTYFPADGLVPFTMNMFDNEEHTTTDPDNPFSPQPRETVKMGDELNIRSVPQVFDFGWAVYNFDNGALNGITVGANLTSQVLNYKGAPVLPVIIDFNKGLSIRQAAWTDGVVFGNNNTVLKDYQYTTAPTTTVGQ